MNCYLYKMTITDKTLKESTKTILLFLWKLISNQLWTKNINANSLLFRWNYGTLQEIEVDCAAFDQEMLKNYCRWRFLKNLRERRFPNFVVWKFPAISFVAGDTLLFVNDGQRLHCHTNAPQKCWFLKTNQTLRQNQTF